MAFIFASREAGLNKNANGGEVSEEQKESNEE
jgi:hypothetical protein